METNPMSALDGIKEKLAHPAIYQMFQEAGGFFGARLKAIKAYLPLRGTERIVDIGCGPGFIVKHLPVGIEYIGYDPSHAYIEYAKQHFGNRGRFIEGFFDEAAASAHAGVDIIMLNGVLHHMTDVQVANVTRLANKALVPGGRLFTLDGCYVSSQSALAKLLLDNDRGRHVRTEPRYRALISEEFERIDSKVDHKFSRIPYTFLTMVAHKGGIEALVPSAIGRS
jgi:SAM-dependent methyltransferase